MRPHRESTPILLVLVCLLFVLVAFLRLRDALTGRPPGDRWTTPLPVERLREVGEDAVGKTWAALLPGRDEAGTRLFAMLRSPVTSAPMLLSHEVDRPVPVPGVELRGGRVQLEILERRAFLPGDLPHAGRLRVEATYLRDQEAVWRSWAEREYRLVRVGLPPPLVEGSLVLTHPERLVDPGSDPPLATLRADLAEARETLAALSEARLVLEDQARQVARRLVEFTQGVRHRAHVALEPPEALAANWIDALPPLEEANPVDPVLEGPLVAGWQSVDLSRWGRHASWAERLRLVRQQAREARGRAWSEWREGVERWFDPEAWEDLDDAVAVHDWVTEVAREAAEGLRRVGKAGATWSAYEVQRIQHHRDPEEFFEEASPRLRARLEDALARCRPESWRAQAWQVFEGEDASARCGRFLEGIGAPFAKEFVGVLFVDNAGGAPLVLADTTVPGRLVVVATGDVRLANLGPRDSAHHRVVVQVEGRLELAGRVRAFVLARGPVHMDPDAHVVGGLILDGPGSEDRLQGHIDWDPTARRLDPLEDLVVLLEEPAASAAPEPEAGQ